MRFLLKMAFWLALIAFFLPSPTPDDPDQPGVNYLSAFLGAQEAISDMSGFCERSPMACAAGGEIGSFVAARVGDGIAYAYAFAQGHAAPGSARTVVTLRDSPAGQPAAPNALADPMQTAAVAAEHVRRATGLPPFASPAVEAEPATIPDAAVLAPSFPAIPTPAPRA